MRLQARVNEVKKLTKTLNKQSFADVSAKKKVTPDVEFKWPRD